LDGLNKVAVRKARKKKQPVRTLFDQVLEEDYWEGYYAASSNNVVCFEDCEGSSVSIRAYSLNDGKQVFEESVKIVPSMTFRMLSDRIAAEHGCSVFLRLSDSIGNPDRHEEISRIFASGDRFELMRIGALVQHLRSKGISILGGVMGGRDLYDGGYEGFYLLKDGKILYCRDCSEWDQSRMDYIVDGVVSYFVLEPGSFSLDFSREDYFGYLRGESFSDLNEYLSKDHGRVVSELGVAGSEIYGILMDALGGNPEAVSVASHKLRLNLSN